MVFSKDQKFLYFMSRNACEYDSEWQPMTVLSQLHKFNFDRYIYRLFDVTYYANTKSFKAAYDQYLVLSKLKA